MKPPVPPRRFLATFDASILARFIAAITSAYGNACEKHDPNCGSNESTFGTCVYHFCVHELCERTDDELELESRAPVFRLKLGDYQIACHRVGRRGSENIYQSFPKNEGAAHKMAPASDQLDLDFSDWVGEQSPDLEGATRLVLAHLGNSDDGVQAIYLCFPGKIEGKRIVSWEYAHLIWSSTAAAELTVAGQDDVPEPANDVTRPAPKVERAAEEKVEKATVKRRKKPHADDGSE